MVPILRLGFGLSAYASTATSLFTIIPTSLSGAATHLRNKTCIPQLGLALGLGGAITSALGVYLGSVSPSWAIMLVAGLIIGYSAFNMLRKARKLRKRQRAGEPSMPPAEGRPPAAQPPAAGASPASQEDAGFAVTLPKLAGGFGIGLVAGLASGYVGVGGGFIMVPLMTAWLGVPMNRASGTSLIAIIILAVPGVVEQGMLGTIDYLAGLLMACGSVPGAMLGARLVSHVPEYQLRLLFAAFLGVAAVMLVVNEFHLL